LRDALANELRLDRATIHVIPTCVHLPQHSPTPFSAREPAILHMGTARHKRAEDSLAAFDRLADPSVTLYITGSPNESVTTALRTLPSVLQDKVRLLGVVPAAELTALLHRVRCVSVPSHYDIPVLSPTVLESMAARTPVVCSPSISRDLIAPGTNCRVAHSPDELATAWRELLDDEAAWKQSSAAGYDTVQRFTPAAVADAYARVAATLLRPG
jgi:glycosyltransferase involved in cell wall biosynthesis